MPDFLFELGLEEIPARMIAGAEAELGRRITDLLMRERLLAPESKFTTYSTPRRLAVLVEGVLEKQADAEEQLTGPSWKVAFKDGAPAAAAEAFAKKAGVAVTELEKVTTPKGEYVGVTVKRPGRAAGVIIAAELSKEVFGLYWAKNMYWRAGKPERFVRPVRWVVAMLDSEIVPLEIAGIAAGNASRGHRVLHGEAPVAIDSAKNYSEKLRAASVIASVAERRHIIRKALDAATRAVAGARWREDEPLVETVVNLTEWPSVILGDFESEYLSLPEEVLVTVMRDHQKYFAIEDGTGKLAPHFLAVLNTEVDDEGRAIIRHGNERVLRSRFKDARFFWDFDQKIPLVDRVESLKNVTFKKELGSYYDKTQRNRAVAQVLSETVRSAGVEVDQTALLNAVELAKTDLTTELVKEFTELQGKIGGLYARAQELGEVVASAIYYQFKPSWARGEIPPTVEGQLLGLADRIETITAMFEKGFEPTGSKDPFALRRAASGIVKILDDSQLPLTLRDVLGASGTEAEQGVGDDGELQPDSPVRRFLKERLDFHMKEVRGLPHQVVNAVLRTGADDVRDAIARATDITAKLSSKDFIAVSGAFRRMKNILRQAEENGEQIGARTFQQSVLKEPEEIHLYEAAQRLAPRVELFRARRNYSAALEAIATLRPEVDAFFEKVMVMAPDPNVRATRLGLIQFVLDGFSTIADFSEIVTQ